MKLRFLLLSLFFSVAMFAQNGTVTGTILDKEFNNEPLAFANIIVKGTKQGTSTDVNGKYSISLKPGSYTLVIGYLGYETKEIPFTIKANEKKVINYTLEPSGVQLNDVEIVQVVSKEKESALLQEQLKAVEIKQSIGAQEMSRKGISNVETGLTKVTGITKVESRGLFIRGLEDRYNNLLINNLAVPSNSPFKKIIPLDLFPTDIVGYMDIFKTFNPNVYGDFAGATIDINTTQPTESYTKISYGVGYVTNNNMRDFLISSDADNSKSFFGFGGQERALPSGFGSIPNGQINNNFESTWNVNKISSPLNTSFGVTHANKFDVGKKPYRMYYFISANFDNKYQYREGIDRIFQNGQGIYQNDLRKSQYKFGTQASALFSLNFKSDRLKITTNSLFIKATENLIQDQRGFTGGLVQNNELIRLNQYDESNYFANQIQSEYKLSKDGKHSLKGGLSYTRTKFNQPDRKFINGTIVNEEDIEVRFGSNNFIRQFLDVENNFHMSGLMEYNYKFGKNEDKQNKIAFGYNGYAEYMKTSYRFIAGLPNNANLPASIVNVNNIDSFVQNAIANNEISFREETGGEYKTKINNRVDGFYGNITYNIAPKLELNVGLRAENTIRDLKYRKIIDPIGSPYRKIETNQLDILPSLNLKYAVSETKNIRFAASRTITRPVLFESLPITYINADGTSERGNELLVNSTNNNVDLKFEVFPTKDEIFAVTAFGKYIENPIERTFDNASSSQQVAYYNNKSATLLGLEFETILQLSRLNYNLKGASFGFNTSIMHTEAIAETNRGENGAYFDTFEKRQLQGASNWLVNADLKYDFKFSEKWTNTATLVYGVYGERIYAVGIAGLDHVYEKPFHKLDLIWSQNINKAWDVKLSIDNLLNPTYERVLGDESQIPVSENSLTVQSYKRGTGFSLGASYKF
ncbi:TonB-dependent receptor [Flavobacterium sp.]|uniref:TonB-dependent receptor n=1 Tax=Flavobacterium sp. TaxID=239 RepID=UPI002FDE10D8